jgi:hypothetical protein
VAKLEAAVPLAEVAGDRCTAADSWDLRDESYAAVRCKRCLRRILLCGARTVRIQVITPPAALTREGQKQIVREATEIVARLSGDPSTVTTTIPVIQRSKS